MVRRSNLPKTHISYSRSRSFFPFIFSPSWSLPPRSQKKGPNREEFFPSRTYWILAMAFWRSLGFFLLRYVVFGARSLSWSPSVMPSHHEGIRQRSPPRSHNPSSSPPPCSPRFVISLHSVLPGLCEHLVAFRNSSPPAAFPSSHQTRPRLILYVSLLFFLRALTRVSA